MVGRCKCGNFKFNMHNTSLTEIPWVCYECRCTKEFNTQFRTIVRSLPHVAPKPRSVKVLLDIRNLEFT